MLNDWIIRASLTHLSCMVNQSYNASRPRCIVTGRSHDISQIRNYSTGYLRKSDATTYKVTIHINQFTLNSNSTD